MSTNIESDSLSDRTGQPFGAVLADVEGQVGDWDKFGGKLKSRKKKSNLRKLLGPNCLFWGVPTESVIHHSTTARLLQLKSTRKVDTFDWSAAARDWLGRLGEVFPAEPSVQSSHGGAGLSIDHSIEAIAWADAAPLLAARLSPEEWCQIVARLVDLVTVSVDEQANAGAGNFVTQLLLQVELPMVLTHGLTLLPVCKSLGKPARSRMARLFDEHLDVEGTPREEHIADIQLLLASSARILTLDTEVKRGRLDKAVRSQFDWLARQTLRWARPNGTSCFGSELDSPHFDSMMKCVLKLTDDETDMAAFRLFRGKREPEDADIPEPAEHSEWARSAMMRTSWRPNSARLGVTYGSGRLNWELASGRQVISSGGCLPKISIDEQPLQLGSSWEEICWESDRDMDYIELECKCAGGIRLQRQFLLSRSEQFAFVADAIMSPRTTTIEYQHSFPLASGVVLEQAEETTEATIIGTKRLGTVVPLPLSEWQSAQGDNRMRLDPARLELKQRGRALYAPLFFDLDPKRSARALTWRQLSVAEQLRMVQKDVAVAYRIQIGKKQWVVYRSLDPPGNRTFLGVNLTSDFLLARFGLDGETEPVIDVTA